MEAPRRTLLAALSADVECARRIWRLYGEREGLVLVIASDPDDLLRVVVPLTRIQRRAGSDLAGVLIDLTTPLSVVAGSEWPAAEHTADLAVTAKSAIKVIDHLAELGIGSTVPLIVVSADEILRAHLESLGIAPRTVLSPADDDATWSVALDTVLTAQRQPKRTEPRRSEKPRRIIPPPTASPLRDDLWFDPAACELLRRERRIPLTARESSLLAILLRAPCTYIPASELARRLTLPGDYPVDAHSIEQTISTLRRELGEHKGHPRLLRVRRGVGYGIFPQIS